MTTPNAGKDTEKLTTPRFVDVNVKLYSYPENSLEVSYKIDMQLPYDPETVLNT